jgi:small subunit ribosomal protein S17
MSLQENQKRGRKIEVLGEVVSAKMQKTISVEVYRMVRHPKYGKYLKKSSVFKAHDEKGEAKEGDKVRIRESRPLSKTKRWTLVEVLESRKG